ncbi:F-box protein At3g58530 [Asparagus officinalis]|uniref:F-box protein At3g58530 n=1 Tax=Asparagus officinalis TaxID=4686 RepID=UPI00098E33BC|nr:F-box protein At3g58530 [Asparagus officinalis]
MGEDEEESSWAKETTPKIIKIICSRNNPSLSQRDLYSLLLVSPSCYRALLSVPNLWETLDLREVNRAGEKLISALSLERYRNVKRINLEFARDVEDEHLVQVKSKAFESLQGLECLNLNGCQKISDKGVDAITSVCPEFRTFSIYWNVRITDLSIKHLVKNCKHITDLNLSGCKNITDQSLFLIADIQFGDLVLLFLPLNITRCVKLTDVGLQKILPRCVGLQSLNLYALSSFTDKAYENIANLVGLRFLDLCGAQNLTDHGLSCIARCKNLVSLNLTWCVRITDVGVVAIAQGCRLLEFLSLFGIVGVTDTSLEALSRFCSNTLTTLDVNGCTGIKRRSRQDLLQLFPHLRCFKVHS